MIEHIQIAQAGNHPWQGVRIDPPRLRYAVVKHPAWTDFEEPGMSSLLPSAMQLHDSATQPYKGATIPIFKEWRDYAAKINNADGLRYFESVGSLFINNDYEQGETPLAECVMSGDNLIAWYQDDPTSETGSAVKILTFSHLMKTGGLSPYTNNIYYQPHLFWRCTAFNRGGYTFKVWGGVDCFIPQIKKLPCWILKKDIIIKPSVWQPTLPIDPFKSWLL